MYCFQSFFYLVVFASLVCSQTACGSSTEPSKPSFDGSSSDETNDGESDQTKADEQGEDDSGSVDVSNSDDDEGDTSDENNTGGDDDTEDTGDETEDPTVPQADCDNLPSLPVEFRKIPDIAASEDFFFDRTGGLVGVDLMSGALVRTTYDGTQEVILPGIFAMPGLGFVRGTRALKNGDVMIADPTTGNLLRVDSSGNIRVVLSDLPDPNGIAIGFDGHVYLTHGMQGGEIRRINPDTGEYSIIHSEQGRSYDGITFGPKYDRLYFNEEVGTVHEMKIDPSGNASGEKVLTMIDKVEILDGMAVDECGNLYVVEMNAMVWKIDAETGEKEVAVDFKPGTPGSRGAFVPAINFGSGKGGWKSDAFYVMNFSGGVFEVDIGVRGKPEPHLSR